MSSCLQFWLLCDHFCYSHFAFSHSSELSAENSCCRKHNSGTRKIRSESVRICFFLLLDREREWIILLISDIIYLKKREYSIHKLISIQYESNRPPVAFLRNVNQMNCSILLLIKNRILQKYTNELCHHHSNKHFNWETCKKNRWHKFQRMSFTLIRSDKI